MISAMSPKRNVNQHWDVRGWILESTWINHNQPLTTHQVVQEYTLHSSWYGGHDVADFWLEHVRRPLQEQTQSGRQCRYAEPIVGKVDSRDGEPHTEGDFRWEVLPMSGVGDAVEGRYVSSPGKHWSGGNFSHSVEVHAIQYKFLTGI